MVCSSHVVLWLASDLEWQWEGGFKGVILGKAAVVKDFAANIPMHLSPHQVPESKLLGY